MRRNPRVITACVVFAVCLATVRLHGQDAEGCKDSPLITRFPGAVIHSCENKEFDQADFPLNAEGKVKHLEGRIQSLDYGTREGLSELQVYRNMETASRKAGFIIDYAGSPYDLVAHKDLTWVHIESKGTYYYQTIVTETGCRRK